MLKRFITQTLTDISVLYKKKQMIERGGGFKLNGNVTGATLFAFHFTVLL